MSDDDRNNVWVDGGVPFGLFWHESYNEKDYRLWAKEGLIITTLTRYWVFEDFCKPNIDSHGAVSAKNLPVIQSSYIKNDSEGTTLLLRAVFKSGVAAVYGLPEENWIEIAFPKEKKRYDTLYNGLIKRLPCLPDAYWFSMGFVPEISRTGIMDKLGRQVSPMLVVEKGGRYLHGINSGIIFNKGIQKIAVESLDCPIVCSRWPSLI